MGLAASARVGFTISTGKKTGAPFEDHVGIQRISTRNLRHGNVRCRRLNTDRPLLLVSPKPFRPPNHPKPHSVRYPKRTLSDPLYLRQGSETGRLQLIQIVRNSRQYRPVNVACCGQLTATRSKLAVMLPF
jgi:hypothetical protein